MAPELREMVMNWDLFLKIMRMDEEAARQKYMEAASITDDPRIKEVLERLAYEEEIHAGLLLREEQRLAEAAAK